MVRVAEGWVAECQDCPTTVGVDYGELIKVHEEFPLDCYLQAELWAVEHARQNPEHYVEVRRFTRLEAEFVNVNPDVMKLLFGDDFQPPSGD